MAKKAWRMPPPVPEDVDAAAKLLADEVNDDDAVPDPPLDVPVPVEDTRDAAAVDVAALDIAALDDAALDDAALED
jgi:hypothetical protein